MIETDKAIMKLERIFRKVDKFHTRKFIDRDNHSRREARMQKRKQERWDANYTIFYGGMSEEE